MRAVVLGIGNVLMGDEGVGVRAVEVLVRRYELAEGVNVVDGGTAGMALLPVLEGLGLLIVADAVRFGQAPGSVIRLEGDAVPAFFKTKLSPHQAGLADLLASLAFKGSAPGRVIVIGVVPETLSLGMELSATVEARQDEVAGLLVAELAASGFPSRLREGDGNHCAALSPHSLLV